jgi:hypothetical protein
MKRRSDKAHGGGDKPLPEVNVDFAVQDDAGKMTADKMRSLICNPIYVGIGPFPALIDDETWVRAAAQMIKKEGSEQFLVNMLYVLRQSLGTQSIGSQDEIEDQ